MNGPRNQKLKKLYNLQVWDMDLKENLTLPTAYAQNYWPFSHSEIPTPEEVKQYEYLKDVPFKFAPKAKVGLLIGMNVPSLLYPMEIVPPTLSKTFNGPYATLHALGWALQGPSNILNLSPSIRNLSTQTEDWENIENKIQRLFARDFIDDHNDEVSPSKEELLWYDKVKQNCTKLPTNNFEIDLPFKNNAVEFPRNRLQALRRFQSLKIRLQKDKQLSLEYDEFMQTMISRKFATKVPENELITDPGKSWYLVHHGVRHKQKGKLRIVFDCSLKCQGVSLNNQLLKGPDLTNNLVAVLLRFRKKRFALSGDIEKMYYQVKVPSYHQDYMRFFWKSDRNDCEEPMEYRLGVHVFGAVSSPAVANYALRKTVSNLPLNHPIRECVELNFYVDDLLVSVDNEEEGIQLIRAIKTTLNQNGFNLTSFSSNSRKILNDIPIKDRTKKLNQIDIWEENLPAEGALGVTWNAENDTLGFKIKFEEKPITRRNILSHIFSIYDPLGLIAPVLIPARRIFQETCRLKLSWDDVINERLQNEWKKWQMNVATLSTFTIPRCYKPIGDIISNQLHIFADGSLTAYGAIAYARMVTSSGHISCVPILGKARTTPLDRTTLRTIPRIELNAAKLAVVVFQLLKRILFYEKINTYFWTDSEVVLRYLNNESSNFQTFIANRLHFIANASDTSQWRHVPTRENPADLISRGCSADTLAASKLWTNGPTFLNQSENHWPSPFCANIEVISDLEIKKTKKIVAVSLNVNSPTINFIRSRSSWLQLKKKTAAVLRIQRHFHKVSPTKLNFRPFSTQELKEAEIALIRHEQYRYFSEVFKLLRSADPLVKKRLPLNHELSKLTPKIDENSGLLVVNGRLLNSNLPYEFKCPIILPRKSDVTALIIKHSHATMGHMGVSTTLAHLREIYWLITPKSTINRILKSCLICKKAQGRPLHPVMANLPPERLQGDVPPFTNTGTDCFGPFHVYRGRTTQKRYGAIFVCMASKAIHLEVLPSLETSSFINAFRRFQSYFPGVTNVRSDNGTNLVGAEKELRQAIRGWNKVQIEEHMLQKNINWKFSAPCSSHQNGIWERQIRTVRRIFSNLMKTQLIRLRDDDLVTFFHEARFIINSRPLCALSNEINDFEALTANHLLQIKGGSSFPPGLFQASDCYSKRRWLQVQYLIELFWKRWHSQCLPLLQERQKWRVDKRSYQPGDLVLVIDQLLPRGNWCLGRIQRLEKDGENRVAWVKVNKSNVKKQLSFKCTVLRRPVNKLILLRTCSELSPDTNST